MSIKVELRKIIISDTANIIKWRNSEEVRRNLFSQIELTEEYHIKYLHDIVETGKCFQYIIVIKENGNSIDIGTVFIKNIDYKNCKGEFGIFIGESSARGKGYAKLATIEILRIAFTEIMLNRVYLTVIFDNIAAIKSYEKAGFKMEGRLRSDYCRNGEYVDVIIMGITKEMWYKNILNISLK